MDLKFSFSAKTPDHSHGADGQALPAGVSQLGLTPAPTASSELWVRLTLDETAVRAEAVSGDDNRYANAQAPVRAEQSAGGDQSASVDPWVKAGRSALSRAIAELGEQLASSITGLTVSTPENATQGPERMTALFAALGIPQQALTQTPMPGIPLGASDLATQRRTGLPAGTPLIAAAAEPKA